MLYLTACETDAGHNGDQQSPKTQLKFQPAHGARAKAEEPENPRLAQGVETLPGFEAEVLYEVPGESQGSWVAICTGPDGTLFTSDQYGALYQVLPPVVGDYTSQIQVTKLDIAGGAAQGLCWAFDALYVMDSTSGLKRLTDSDGDGQLDTVELLIAITGGGEHGTHALTLAPDGESLLMVCGNHTALPALTSSRVPEHWAEDLLLPREWDARGHARGVLAPGGYICRISPDASEVELLSIGYRNSYDAAVNPQGEIFTYDADMEWDFGMPWYRPTRVCHVVSGSEFGWRSGTGKWPTYYPDSLPPVVDIGPGSPVGVLFGTGAAFPEEYQRALFLLDWTFGTMYAMHLSPDGATYTGELEEFLHGKPLPLTDAVVGSDGHLYFLTGGRRLQSRLYRVSYNGQGDTAPAVAETKITPEAQLRRDIEAFHQVEASTEALDTIWPALSHDDRFVRYAARVALEFQDPEAWRERALQEANPKAKITALLALCRNGYAGDRASVIASLNAIDLDALSEGERLETYRAYALAFIRLGEADAAQRQSAIDELDPRFPSDSPEENAELAQLLAYLEAPGIIEKCLTLMESPQAADAPQWASILTRNDGYGGTIQRMLENPPPTAGLHYAFILRNTAEGWTLTQRERYFGWLADAKLASGGESYVGFLNGLTQQALATCNEEDKLHLDTYLANRPAHETTLPEIVQPEGPTRVWTVEEAVQAVEGQLTGRDFARGAGLYRAANCDGCHRFDGYGESTAPDLSTVGNTFELADLLSATIDPNKDITDQYAWSIVVLEDGGIHVGRIVSEDEGVMTINTDAFDSSQTVQVEVAKVLSQTLMPESPMPPMLINPMNEDELRDLVAYLLSGGDEDDAMFE